MGVLINLTEFNGTLFMLYSVDCRYNYYECVLYFS